MNSFDMKAFLQRKHRGARAYLEKQGWKLVGNHQAEGYRSLWTKPPDGTEADSEQEPPESTAPVPKPEGPESTAPEDRKKVALVPQKLLLGETTRKDAAKLDDAGVKLKFSHEFFDYSGSALLAMERGDMDALARWAFLAGLSNANSSARYRKALAGALHRTGKRKFSDDELRAAIERAEPGAKVQAVQFELNEARKKRHRSQVSLTAVQDRIRALKFHNDKVLSVAG